MRRPDDLPTDLPVEWRQVIRSLAELRQMEPPKPSLEVRRKELRKQAAGIRPAAEQEKNEPCQNPATI